jgi:hypothetical protein
MRMTTGMLAACLAVSPLVGCGSSTVSVPGPAGQGSKSSTVLEVRQNGEPTGPFEVSGFGSAFLDRLRRMDVSDQFWAAIFSVRVDGKADVPPLLGSYAMKGDTLTFQPRFPLQRGVLYRAVVHADKIPTADGENYAALEKTFRLPRPDTAPTFVGHVYPTRDVLPENQLRFYVHFSAPMSRGDVYKYVRLLGPDGKPVELPFLELEQGLWDVSSQRFTLLVQPGRIKRGLVPREEMGPVLEAGKSYTLEISRDWPDAEGEPLKDTYRKTFRAGPPDETQPDPKTWKLQAPAAGQSEPLVVTFPKPLDHAMLERVLWVTGDGGRRVEGTVDVTDEETRWRFTPKEAWKAGAYDLVADTALEDPTGNSIAHPFEVDVFHPIERSVETKTVKVPFTVK